MAGKLGSLEVELLAIILELVDDTSPKTTRSVALVNRHLNATARVVGFRRQRLDFTDRRRAETDAPANPSLLEEDGEGRSDENENDNHGGLAEQEGQELDSALNDPRLAKTHELINSWLVNPEALRSIRHLTIVGHGSGTSLTGADNRTLARWMPLAQLIKSLTNLRTLTWAYGEAFPLIVLDAIHQAHPRSQLKILGFQRRRDDLGHLDPVELALSKSPALTVFKAEIWKCDESVYPDLRQAAFQRIIASAPNLRHVSLVTGDRSHVFRVLSSEQQAELHEQEERFYTHTKPNDSVRSLCLDGYGLSLAVIERFGRFIDFSKVQDFQGLRGLIPNQSYFTKAAALLPSLRHLSINLSYNRNPDLAAAVENYLLACLPLQTISIWAWMGKISLDSILRHGPCLKHLQLHERESFDYQAPRKVMTADDVRRIRETCPLLEDFTMDINREQENWEDEVSNAKIYDEIGQFGRQFNRCQLYFNVGLAGAIERAGRLSRGRYPRNGESHSELQEQNGEASGPSPKRARAAPNGLSASELALLNPPPAEPTFAHIKHIWKTIFGSRRVGDRALDVKFGEWERKPLPGYPSQWMLIERERRSFVRVRPHERDDMLDQSVVSADGKLQNLWSLPQ